jgi:uncharacterized membrane protein
LISFQGVSEVNVRSKSNRLLAVDALRGLIIVVMALDHANHFVAQKHPTGEQWGGPFPIYRDSFSFLTRFITHLAAPGFFFLMGVGMLLFAKSRRRQGWSRWAVIRYFVLRGLLLILLQFILVNRAWELSPGGWMLGNYVGVLFALGGTMILASFLLWLPPMYILAITVVLFLSTELMHPAPELWSSVDPGLLELLFIFSGGDLSLWSNYPILPWLELVTFGLVFGYWLDEDSKQAFNRGLWLGIVFLFAFILLRLLDSFGNIRPRASDSWIDFLNVVKYPPSMVFTLLTTGMNLIIFWLFSKLAKARSIILESLAVFGQAPLFFYILHLFLYAALGYLFAPSGTSIIAMYPYWLLGLILLYPLCLWYGRFKQRKALTSLWRLF